MIDESITFVLSTLTSGKDFYLNYWIQWWTLVPTTIALYTLYFCLGCVFECPSISPKLAIKRMLSLNLPGATRRRIEFLRTKFSTDWEKYLSEEKPYEYTSYVDEYNFARAYTDNNTDELYRISKLLGSYWSFWFLPLFPAILIAFFLPLLIAVVIVIFLVSLVAWFANGMPVEA